MTKSSLYGFIGVALSVGLIACDPPPQQQQEEALVDFDSAGAQLVRARACEQDWDAAARKGAGAESYNSSLLWSVSPYQVLIPNSGSGFVNVNIDAPHYDWLIYVDKDVVVEAIAGMPLESAGPVEECPDRNLVEYGAHMSFLGYWPLRLDGDPLSHAKFYSGLAATDHSDPSDAGHAGHDLSGDENAPTHGGH